MSIRDLYPWIFVFKLQLKLDLQHRSPIFLHDFKRVFLQSFINFDRVRAIKALFLVAFDAL